MIGVLNYLQQASKILNCRTFTSVRPLLRPPLNQFKEWPWMNLGVGAVHIEPVIA